MLAGEAVRIGYLWLHGGEWNGSRIVSRQWVKESSSVQMMTGAYWDDNHGYGWWIMKDDDFPQVAAVGRGGQRIAVFPTLDIVAVMLGGGFDSGEILESIGSALVTSDIELAPLPQSESLLRVALGQFTLPPMALPVQLLPAKAARISGRTCRFEPNALSLETITLGFDGIIDDSDSLSLRTIRVHDLSGQYGVECQSIVPAGIQPLITVKKARIFQSLNSQAIAVYPLTLNT